MDVKFFSCRKKTNSTARPHVAGTTIACTLKDNCDMIRPKIALKAETLGVSNITGNSPAGYNYAQIPLFGNRYYWVENWEFVDRQWVAHLVSDPLATWQDEILASTKVICRVGVSADADKYTYIPDSMFPPNFYHSDSYSEVSIPGFVDSPAGGGSLVVGFVGNGNAGLYQCGGVGYGVLSQSSMGNLMQEAFTSRTPVISSGWEVTDAIGALIDNLVKGVLSPSQYINSIIWYPYTVTKGTDLVKPVLGFYQTSTVTAQPLAAPTRKISFVIPVETLCGSNTPTLNEYCEPYTTYYLELWPFGIFPINGRTLISPTTKGIQIDITIDQITSTARFSAYRSTETTVTATPYGGAYLCGGSATLGVSIPIAGATSNTLQGLANAVGTVAGLSNDSGGAFSVASSVLTGAAATASAVSPRAVTAGSCTGFAGISSKARLYRTKFQSNRDVAEKGKACFETGLLSAYVGKYVECWDGEMTNILTANRDEREMIKSALTGGVYLERDDDYGGSVG